MHKYQNGVSTFKGHVLLHFFVYLKSKGPSGPDFLLEGGGPNLCIVPFGHSGRVTDVEKIRNILDRQSEKLLETLEKPS